MKIEGFRAVLATEHVTKERKEETKIRTSLLCARLFHVRKAA